MKITTKKAKKRLALLWLSASGILILIVIFQTLNGRYAGSEEKAWAWLLPLFLPTLALILSTFVIENRDNKSEIKYADIFFYKLTFALTIFYFFLIYITIFMQPLLKEDPITIMCKSNLWLIPIQGLVAISLGAFFIKKGDIK